MAQQLITEPPMYKPKFNPVKFYYDENPFTMRQRNLYSNEIWL